MKAIRFHTVIGEDGVIRIPPGFLVTPGEAEVIVLQPEDWAVGKAPPAEPDQQAGAPREHIIDRLAKIAEELGIDDLPEDFSENYKLYAHRASKGIDQP